MIKKGIHFCNSWIQTEKIEKFDILNLQRKVDAKDSEAN